MIKLGANQKLIIARETSVGCFLKSPDGDIEVLLPRKFTTEHMKPGEEVEVFVFKDSEDRLIATTEIPLITVGEFASLKVNQVNNIGAFMDWGIMGKELLVPYGNQDIRMEEGESYIIYLYEDPKTERLVGTTKLNRYLAEHIGGEISVGDEVDLLVRNFTEIGVGVIVNQKYHGMVYHDEVFQELKTGDKLKGYVKFIRWDQKLDISLNPLGVAAIEPNARTIMISLRVNDGFLPFHDKSDPEEIRKEFGMSKKAFKKAIGTLYKQKLIEIREDGIASV